MPENESEINEPTQEEIVSEETISGETFGDENSAEETFESIAGEAELNAQSLRPSFSKNEGFGKFNAFEEAPKNDTSKNIERLLDVEMNVTVRFGLTEMPLREVVRFGVGSMIELNRTIDEPVELLVNNYPFARGEVVVIDGYYGVRVTEIGTPEERSKTLFSNN